MRSLWKLMAEQKPDAEVLLEKKRAWAAENGKEACQNPRCGCVSCDCGEGCTCNVSPEVTCDPCKEMKATMAAKKADAEKLQAAEQLWDSAVAPKFPGLPSIRAAELMARQKEAPDEVVLVDCRGESERAVSTLPGNVVTMDAFEADPAAHGTGKLVVPFCLIGGRSAPLVQRMMEREERPWKEMRNFHLSLLDWCFEHGPLVSPEGGETNKVFVPGAAVKDMIASGYEVLTP